MRYLSFKILFLCILLPPVMFIISVEAIQKIYIDGHLEARYTREIQNGALGDTRSLLNGTAKLKDSINRNIRKILKKKRLISLGVKARITVLTQQGTVLYPPFYEIRDDIMAYDHIQVATHNLRLMNEGLVVKVELVLGYNTLLSILILSIYMSFSLCFLYYHYRSGVQRSITETIEKNKEIKRLENLEKDHRDRLLSLERDRAQQKDRLGRLQKTLDTEKAKATQYEDELVEEIIAFEEKIENNLLLQQEQEEEIEALKERIALFEKDKRKDRRQKKREKSIVEKRFKTLYKNILIHDRTVSGFIDLTEEMKIKGEEIIRQLNDQPDLVTIKRKVFGKKGRQTVFETVFAYKGRIYFRKTKDGRIELLSVGTKNTQVKDLDFLNNL
jgi:hypothetical protein